MNPPRIELENAVRLLFREHGVAVKKARTFEKGRNKEAIPEGAPEGKQTEGPLAPADAGQEGTQKETPASKTAPLADPGKGDAYGK